ncbi:MAG: extracellular solute-binding protein [Leifsonia sp.]
MKIKKPKRFIRAAAAVTIVGLGLALVGCSSHASSTPDTSKPVTINYWGWVPGVQKLVTEWNAKNPDIHVDYSALSAGDSATFSKITTAAKAGDGPDLVQADVKWVPSLIPYAKDVTSEAAQYKKNYAAGAWSNVTISGVTYGLPQDSGPMIMYYNKAAFAQYGLAVPTTWDQFAAESKQLSAQHPGTDLGSLSSDDVESFESYVQQAGGKWWSINGDSWKVDTTSAASTKVANYWQSLLDAKAVSTTNRWDPSYSNALANGKILSVIGAAWQAPLIASNAAASSGKWSVAPMPQWKSGQSVSANNGGSQLMVLQGSKHSAQALKFANWLDTNVSGLLKLGLFPAATTQKIQTPAAIEKFFGGADVYSLLSKAATNVKTQWLFPPIYTTVGPTNSDEVAGVLSGNGTLPDLLTQVQSDSLSAFKSAGISAKASN